MALRWNLGLPKVKFIPVLSIKRALRNFIPILQRVLKNE
jgi:hypothetical protein